MTTLTQNPAELISEREERLIEASDNRRAVLETIGMPLGFYDVLEQTPVIPEELASNTGASNNCARRWLETQCAGDCLDYDSVTARYSIWRRWPEGD